MLKKLSEFIKTHEALANCIIGILTVIIAFVGIFKVTDAIQFTKNIEAENSIITDLCIFYDTEDKTLAYCLYEAQKHYKAGDYSQAIEIYSKYAEESPIACLNLGYMYSKGYGTKRNFDTACIYYKKAYEKGLSAGMDNYLAINLQTPQSCSDVTKALTYSINHGYVKAMLFSAYFETGKMYADYSQEVFEYAVDFINRPQYEQDTKMKEKIYISEVVLEKSYTNTVPESTDFVKYYATDIKSVEVENAKLLSVLEYADDDDFVETQVPVMDFKEVYYYKVYNYSFHCAMDLLEESFYEAVI